jgi:hypothetical protein
MTRKIEAAALALVLLALLPSQGFAQASESEMDAFPMPPPSGYVATKSFAYAGDYGYYTAPASAVPSTDVASSDYRYVRYTNINRKRIYLYGAWGPTPIPKTETGDGCGHAHASYGVWVRYEISILFFRFSGWVRVGGGSMSGVREGERCVFKTDGPLTEIDPRYGWGSEVFQLNCLAGNCGIFSELVLGALSNTHGWGSCTVLPPGSFRACTEPSYLIGYTLPL